MASITDYSTTWIKVVKDNSNVFFVAKDGASVAGVGGKVVLTYTRGQFSFTVDELKSPSGDTLETKVIAVQTIIDNV